MIKKIFVSLLITLSFSVFIHSSVVKAQAMRPAPSTEMIASPDYFPRPTQSANFLGQTHNYSVTFRGNGEAVVSARMIFSNLEEATMSAMTLRVPRVTPQDVMVYQISREPQCMRYRPIPSEFKPQMLGVFQLRYSDICEEYQEPDYTQYWDGGNTYRKADVTMGTDSMTITFPKAIKPNGSGAIIVYYRAVGYAKKDLYGAFNYTFETLKVEDRIQTLQLGISTDSDLILKEAKGKVDYQNTEATGLAMSADMGQKQGAFSSPQMDNYIQQIGYGTVVKSSSNLQPLDSYTVTGSFAESQWQLYGRRILITIVVIVIVLIVLFIIAKKIFHNLHNTKSTDGANGKSVLETVGVGFISSILILGYTLVLIFLMSVMKVIVTYEFEFILLLFMMVISCAIYLLLFVGPALFIGRKRGMGRGFIVAGITVVWLIFYFCILVALLFMFRMSPNSGIYGDQILPNIPMMRGGMESTFDSSSDVMMK